MKKFATGVLIGFLLATLFSAPWMYQAWAVGNCSVFRSWNTGDTVTAGDLNSSFTTAAVTNSTPQCLDDYSATVSQMQSTVDPYASGTESQATSTAGEIERLRFMFKQIFGLSQWYRHDQAPTFGSLSGHIVLGAIHVGSIAHIGQVTGNDTYAARFPTITGPDHWTGIFFPHATAHMAISMRDANHATGGVQGGIELFRFHSGGLVFHHTVALMFKHSESQMHGGQRGHVTALSIDPTTDQLIFGHPGATMRLAGAGITGQGGPNKALFLSAAGHVYAHAITQGPATGHIWGRMGFQDAGSVLGASQTIFIGTWAASSFTEHFYIAQTVPFDATIAHLYVETSKAPAGSETYTFTVMKNGVAQSIVVTISAAGTSGSDSANHFTVSAGDRISLRAVGSTTAASGTSSRAALVLYPWRP